MNAYICPEGHKHDCEPGFCTDCGSALVLEKEAEAVPPSVADSPEASVDPPDLRERIRRMMRNITGTQGNTDVHDVLPADERERGWRIDGDPVCSKAHDQWPVAMTTPDGEVRGVFRRFKTGALTTRQIYEKVLQSSSRSDAMIRLYSYGTVSIGGGARADYEITGLPEGQSLRSWLKQSDPDVDRALYLAPLLAGLLERLHDLDLRPITLDSDMLWICTQSPARVQLTQFGAVAAKANGGASEYRADLSNSALLTLPYAAPELIERRVIGATTETFALGQLLSEALFGEAQDHAFIRDGSVPFAIIPDRLLASLLMGSLWPKPEGRWSIAELRMAFESGGRNMPKSPAWESLCPGASGTAFVFGANSYFRAEDLMQAVPRNWNEAILRFDAILNWLEGTHCASQVDLLRRQMLPGRSRDWILVRLRRLILPQAPIVWRDLSFDDRDAANSLVELAQRSLSDGDRAKPAIDSIHELFSADLRGAFTTVSNP